MRQELDGDLDLSVQQAAVEGRRKGEIATRQTRGNGGRAGGLDALFLGMPRGDPNSVAKVEELKAMVSQLREELEKKRFELCCYIRRSDVQPLTQAQMHDDLVRLKKGGPEKRRLQEELFDKMDLVLQETLIENGQLRDQLQTVSEQLLQARKRERATSPVKQRDLHRTPPPPPRPPPRTPESAHAASIAEVVSRQE